MQLKPAFRLGELGTLRMYQTVAALTRLAALVGYRADTRAQGWRPATRAVGIVTQRAGWRPFAGPTRSLLSSRCTYKWHSCAEPMMRLGVAG